VDDDLSFREAMADLLHCLGFDVDQFDSAEAALIAPDQAKLGSGQAS
jgi:FixJ family two-component response regulator